MRQDPGTTLRNGHTPGQVSAPPNSEPPPQARPYGWITRRRVGYLLIGGAAISMAAVARLVDEPSTLSPAQARDFIQRSGDRLIAILDGPADPATKRRQLQALVNETMDVFGIARFALGRFWNVASNEQRNDYMRIFPSVLLSNVGRAFGSYQGVRFSIDRVTQVNDGVQVSTTVFRPNAPMQQVTWVIGRVSGELRIIDIVAAGTSMRIMQRDDCTSFLARNNNSIPALLETLHRAIDFIS